MVGIDETLERRKGKKIAAKGVYRGPVRSSHSHFVKASGLRWACLALLAEVPWAKRVWALPFLSALAYSERYAEENGKRHKPITEWAWQLLVLVRRRHPEREIVAVADRTYASLKLLDRCRRPKKPITFITRLRLDAALYEPAPPQYPGQMGRPRLKGSRLAEPLDGGRRPKGGLDAHHGERLVRRWRTRGGDRLGYRRLVQHGLARRASALGADLREAFDTQALLCTDLAADPRQIVSWFVRRWQMESTFRECRERLGFETQRHWSEMAIGRTAPALLALPSVVTLFAHRRGRVVSNSVRRLAWYDKQRPTFSDALALARRELWEHETFCGSPREADTVKVPREFVERLTDAVCYAA